MAAAAADKDDDSRMLFQPAGLSKESYGLVLVFVFALCYGLMGTFIQLAVSTGMSSMELVVLRSTFQGLIVVASMCYVTTTTTTADAEAFAYRADDGGAQAPPAATTTIRLIQQPFGTRKVFPIVLARGVIGGVGLLLYFYTMASIPLGDATSVLALSPVITVVASSVVLGEQLTSSVLAAAFATVIGAVLIAKPTLLFHAAADGSTSMHNNNPWGYITGLCGSCTASAVVMLVRMAGTTGGVHTLQLLFSWCLFGSLYAVIILLTGAGGGEDAGAIFSWPSSPQATIYVAFMVVFGVIGHFCMNYGGQFAPAGLSSIVRASLVLWGYCFEFFVFRQVPDVWTVLGALLIVSSVSIIAWQKYQGAKEKAAAAAEVKTTELTESTAGRMA